MTIELLCIGKTREPFIRAGIEKYLKYLKPYAPVTIREIREERIGDLRDAPNVRSKEAEKIRKAIPFGAVVIALDERGKEFTSHEFALFLNAELERATKFMTFVIGGAMGLDESVPKRAQVVLALSRWTLTHEMARLVLLEQLYRAFTIIRGKTYHY